jgi:LPS export ABC transporter protein LptC
MAAGFNTPRTLRRSEDQASCAHSVQSLRYDGDQDCDVKMISSALRNTLLFALLSAAAVGSWFLGRPPQPIVNAVENRDTAPLGYFLRNAVIAVTDAGGTVSHRVFAAVVEQTAEEEDLVLTGVRVEYDADEAIAWQVTAEHAIARNGGDELSLSGTVRLTSRPIGSTDAVVMETEGLQFLPDAYLARATSPVVVVRGGATLRADGMRADLKADRIDLEGVYGQFDR